MLRGLFRLRTVVTLAIGLCCCVHTIYWLYGDSDSESGHFHSGQGDRHNLASLAAGSGSESRLYTLSSSPFPTPSVNVNYGIFSSTGSDNRLGLGGSNVAAVAVDQPTTFTIEPSVAMKNESSPIPLAASESGHSTIKKVTTRPHDPKFRFSPNKGSRAIWQRMPWNEFVSMAPPVLIRSNDADMQQNDPEGQRRPSLRYCDTTVMNNLTKPILSNTDYQFCRYAFEELFVRPGKSWGRLQNNVIGRSKFDELNCNQIYLGEEHQWCWHAIKSLRVRPGKSWGLIKQDAAKRLKFDQLNCSQVYSTANVNPTCDDPWGDASVNLKEWLPKPFGLPCKASESASYNGNGIATAANNRSTIDCKHVQSGTNVYCKMTNVMIDFSKRAAERKRPFVQNFISTHCPGGAMSDEFPIPPSIFSFELSSSSCDVVLNETVILTTHENIYNLAHTMNDVMNLWYVMWLEDIAQKSSQISLLNIDRLKSTGDLEFNDSFSSFFEIYHLNFRNVYRGRSFDGKVLCLKELLVPTRPAKLFVFEGWLADIPCTYAGPSSLYQRWSMQVRNSFQLLPGQSRHRDDSVFQVLLLIRNETVNNWAGQRTSRNFLNTPEIVDAVHRLLSSSLPVITTSIREFKLVAIDVSALSFTKQVELVNHSNLLVGMHGSGIALSLFMSVGSPHCCGVLELFPEGEHKKIRGFGNMARKAGVKYDRLDIDANSSSLNGAIVPVHELQTKITGMVKLLSSPQEGSCLHTALLK